MTRCSWLTNMWVQGVRTTIGPYLNYNWKHASIGAYWGHSLFQLLTESCRQIILQEMETNQDREKKANSQH
jgi:hypothetical protein